MGKDTAMAQAGSGGGDWRAFGDIGINLGSWRWDLESGLVIAERRLADVFNVDRALAEAGAPLALFAAAIDPRDRAAFDRSVDEARQTRGELHVPYRITGPRGNTLWVIGSGSAVDGARAIMGSVTLLWDRDITSMEAAAQFVVAATKIAQALGHRDLIYFLNMALHEIAAIGAGRSG